MQLKVKRLEEERERSLRETESVEEKPDQEKEAGNSASHTPEAAVGDAISGKDSGRSCGESNSTLPKEGEKKLDGDDGKAEEAVGTGGESADPVERLPAGESGESMVAESKGEEEEEGEKEGSDVQCSMSPSRRRRGRRRRLIPGGSNSREEADADADADAGAAEESIIMGKRVAAESEPLMMFLDTIRSDQQVSILERRLGCQVIIPDFSPPPLGLDLNGRRVTYRFGMKARQTHIHSRPLSENCHYHSICDVRLFAQRYTLLRC